MARSKPPGIPMSLLGGPPPMGSVEATPDDLLPTLRRNAGVDHGIVRHHLPLARVTAAGAMTVPGKGGGEW